MISIKLNKQQIEQIPKDFPNAEYRYDIAYTIYQIKDVDLVITAYTSGKVVFAGEKAMQYAKNLQGDTDRESIKISFPMAGSDEVGTGDYFGPVCVCAAYLDENLHHELEKIMIKDSKTLTDAYIMEIGPLLKKKVPHSLLILRNEKYNEIHKQYNLNEIKALLHNQAYLHLNEKVDLSSSVNIIDQFVQEKTYYRYLKKEKNIFDKLIFKTKAESQYPAVAVAAIIARYAFLIEFEILSQKIGYPLAKGSGPQVKKLAKKIFEEQGSDILNQCAKTHFKITQEIQ